LTIILLDLGCRWSEASGLKYDQLDFDNKIITLWRSKTSSAAVLPMSDRVYDILFNKKVKCDWLFPNLTLDGPRGYNIEAFKGACARAGIEGVTFHSLRHSRITRCLVAGMSVAQVQSISGHKDLQSLQRYNHLQSSDVLDQFRDLLNT
jgi:integrase